LEDNYIVKVPEGYKYCPECNLLTPHSAYYIPWREPICDICGYYDLEYAKCPNCGWNHDPDRDLYPRSIMVKKHRENCEALKQETKEDEIQPLHSLRDYDCDCPEVECYSVPHIFNYHEWQPYHLDCYNALEWSYEVRCPICYTVFDVQDGNC
jgi:hypothetical protein